MKQMLAVGLITILLGAGIWIFKPNSSSKSNLSANSELKVKVKEKSKEQKFEAKELYKLKEPLRESPFLTLIQSKAEFNYSQPKQSKEQEKTEKIKSAAADLYLKGIVKKGKTKRVIIRGQNRSHILRLKDTVKGYKLLKIKEEKVVLKKRDQLYYLKLKCGSYPG